MLQECLEQVVEFREISQALSTSEKELEGKEIWRKKLGSLLLV